MNPQNNQHSPTPNKKSHPFWRWFWLSFLVVSLAYAWYSFYVPSNDIQWEETVDLAQEKALKEDKPLLLFFTAKRCVPCKIMKREVFANNEVMEAVNSELIPVMIDVDDPSAQSLVKKYIIGTTPITLFLDSKGEVLDYAVGKMTQAQFMDMLHKVSADYK